MMALVGQNHVAQIHTILTETQPTEGGEEPVRHSPLPVFSRHCYEDGGGLHCGKTVFKNL